MSKQYIFICGAARSGTTALWRLVTAHKSVALGLERYINRAMSPAFLSPDLFERERFFRIEAGDTFYSDLGEFHPYYRQLKSRYERCSHYGDKVPRLYQHLEKIEAGFPGAKILFIVRNIFDVAVSVNKRAQEGKNWAKDRDYRVAVQDWNRSLTSVLQRFHEQDILVVEQETLFSGEADARKIFDFLGLDWTDDVQSTYQSSIARGQEIAERRNDGLTSEEKRYICRQANFAAYRQLLRVAGEAGRLVDVPSSSGEPLEATPRRTKAVAPPSTTPGQVTERPKAQKRVIGKYQAKDSEIVDYQYFHLPGSRVVARGPCPASLEKGGYIAAIGGAQTMGRLVEEPYLTLLGRRANLPVLNLGHGGGKPRYFLENGAIIDCLNRACVIVVQVPSARGVENSVLKPDSVKGSFMTDGRVEGSEAAAFADHAYARLLKSESEETMAKLVQETRQNWCAQMKQLLGALKPPKILLWFSVRNPDYRETFTSREALFGHYPQLVNREMVDGVKPFADDYVQYVGSVGLPQPLRSKLTGQPVNVFSRQQRPDLNYYYPSPEMHDEAARMLWESPVLQAALAEGHS